VAFAVHKHRGRDDSIANFHAVHVFADRFNDTNELVPQSHALLHAHLRPVIDEVKVGTTNSRERHSHDGIRVL
jgi:hypothetical protein